MTMEAVIEIQEEIEEVASLQGVIATGIASYLFSYARPRKLGYVVGDGVEFAVPGLGTKTKKPVAAFISLAKMPKLNDKAVIPFAPDLAVEVISANDDWKLIVAKAKAYITAGTKVVWVVDPYSQSVMVCRQVNYFVTMHPEDTLTGDDILPGFSLPIKDIFDYPVEVEEPKEN
jgi:Uma2 family endonuclease